MWTMQLDPLVSSHLREAPGGALAEPVKVFRRPVDITSQQPGTVALALVRTFGEKGDCIYAERAGNGLGGPERPDVSPDAAAVSL